MKIEVISEKKKEFKPFKVVIGFEREEDVEEWKTCLRFNDIVPYGNVSISYSLSKPINQITQAIKREVEG